MSSIKEKLLLMGSILGAVLTIFNFFNTISPVMNFVIIHWILAPVLFYILALLFVLLYFKQLIDKKIQTAGISNIKKTKKKYTLYRNILIFTLTLLTAGSIAYSYYDIYYIGDNPSVIDNLPQ